MKHYQHQNQLPFADPKDNAFFEGLIVHPLMNLGVWDSYRKQNIKQKISHLQASTILFFLTIPNINSM